MGEAMLAAALGKDIAAPAEISVSDISEPRRRYLEQQYGVTTTGDNRLAAVKAETVVLAVKPQQIAGVMDSLQGRLEPAQLVISIAAGTRIATLCQGLRHRQVVRAMPNTPARIGSGITAWTATPEVTEEQKQRAGSILGATGREVCFDDEKYLDMATAVSGSGPAYVFLLMEALAAAAVDIGLPSEMAREMVLETVLGAARLARETGTSPKELMERVTSPGGTTAAGLQKLYEGNIEATIASAVSAAYERAKELGIS